MTSGLIAGTPGGSNQAAAGGTTRPPRQTRTDSADKEGKNTGGRDYALENRQRDLTHGGTGDMSVMEVQIIIMIGEKKRIAPITQIVEAKSCFSLC